MSTSSGSPHSRDPAPISARTFVFADFEFDEQNWELRRGGVPLAVPPKVMETLAMLLRNRSRVVASREMRETLWPDVTVTEASLLKAIRMARQVLGDDGSAQRFIKTTRARGYRFVAPVHERGSVASHAIRDSAQRATPLSAPSLDDTFVGRDAELDELGRALDAAFMGRGKLLFVSGEAGIGKSRLLHVFGVRAEQRGARVSWGRACEEGGAPEFWPWIQALRALVGPDAPTRDAQLDVVLGASADAPAKAELGPSWPLFRTEEMRFRFFDAVLGFLRRVVARGPIVCLLEDLHMADAASLMLARFLGRELSDAPILLVASYRPSDVNSCPAGPAVFAKLVREASTIRLGGLTEEETRRLIEVTLPEAIDSTFVTRLHRATEGNPLFVSEFLRRVAASSHLPSGLQLEQVEIPERIVEVIRARLDALPEETRDLLLVAAVIGRTFDITVLERVAGVAREDVARRLDPALERNVVFREPGSTSVYRFTHSLVRDVSYETLATARRAALHLRTGEVLEAMFARRPDASAAQLAHHFGRAALVASSEKLIRYAFVAGEQALRSFAFEESAKHFECALEALRFEAGRETLEADTITSLGHARRLAGQYTAACEAFSKSLTLARSLGDPVRTAKAALGYTQVHPDWHRGSREVLSLLEEGVRVLEHADAGRPEVAELLTLSLSKLSTGAFLCGQSENAERFSRRALEIAQTLGDPLTRARALEARHWFLWNPGKAEERLALAAEVLELARTVRDPALMSDARLCELTDLLELGRREAFDRSLRHYERTARAQRDSTGIYNVCVFGTTRALLEGRFDDAEREAREAFALGSRLFGRKARTYFNTALWWARLEQGRALEVETLFRAHADKEPSNAVLRSGLLRTYVEANACGPARELVESLLAEDAHLRKDWTYLPIFAQLAAACELLGDRERAELVRERLLPYENSHVVMGPGTLYLGPVSLYVGLCARTTCRFDEAVEKLEHAVRECHRMRAHALLVRVEYHLAETLVARGGPADLERAQRTLAELRSRSRNLQMGEIERRAVSLDARLERSGAI